MKFQCPFCGNYDTNDWAGEEGNTVFECFGCGETIENGERVQPGLDKELMELKERVQKLETPILEKIKTLPSYGGYCKCEDEIPIVLDDDGEINTYCMRCGGLVYKSEEV